MDTMAGLVSHETSLPGEQRVASPCVPTWPFLCVCVCSRCLFLS